MCLNDTLPIESLQFSVLGNILSQSMVSPNELEAEILLLYELMLMLKICPLFFFLSGGALENILSPKTEVKQSTISAKVEHSLSSHGNVCNEVYFCPGFLVWLEVTAGQIYICVLSM